MAFAAAAPFDFNNHFFFTPHEDAEYEPLVATGVPKSFTLTSLNFETSQSHSLPLYNLTYKYCNKFLRFNNTNLDFLPKKQGINTSVSQTIDFLLPTHIIEYSYALACSTLHLILKKFYTLTVPVDQNTFTYIILPLQILKFMPKYVHNFDLIDNPINTKWYITNVVCIASLIRYDSNLNAFNDIVDKYDNIILNISPTQPNTTSSFIYSLSLDKIRGQGEPIGQDTIVLVKEAFTRACDGTAETTANAAVAVITTAATNAAAAVVVAVSALAVPAAVAPAIAAAAANLQNMIKKAFFLTYLYPGITLSYINRITNIAQNFVQIFTEIIASGVYLTVFNNNTGITDIRKICELILVIYYYHNLNKNEYDIWIKKFAQININKYNFLVLDATGSNIGHLKTLWGSIARSSANFTSEFVNVLPHFSRNRENDCVVLSLLRTDDQCNKILGELQNLSGSGSPTVCEYCGYTINIFDKKLKLTCEHFLEISYLFYLNLITPQDLTNNIVKYENILNFIRSIKCYTYACAPCNQIKAYIQTNALYFSAGTSIFIDINTNNMLIPNLYIINIFCDLVLTTLDSTNTYYGKFGKWIKDTEKIKTSTQESYTQFMTRKKADTAFKTEVYNRITAIATNLCLKINQYISTKNQIPPHSNGLLNTMMFGGLINSLILYIEKIENTFMPIEVFRGGGGDEADDDDDEADDDDINSLNYMFKMYGQEEILYFYTKEYLQNLFVKILAESKKADIDAIIHTIKPYPEIISQLMQIFGPERLMQIFGPELLQQMYGPDYYQAGILAFIRGKYSPEQLMRTFGPELLQQMYPAEYQAGILAFIRGKYSPEQLMQFGPEQLMQMYTPDELMQMYTPDELMQFGPERLIQFGPERLIQFGPERLMQFGPERLMLTFGPELLQRMYPADYQSGILAPLTAYSPEQLMQIFGPELLQQMYPAEYHSGILAFIRGKYSHSPEQLMQMYTPDELMQMYTADELMQMYTTDELMQFGPERLMQFGPERLMQFGPERLMLTFNPNQLMLFFNSEQLKQFGLKQLMQMFGPELLKIMYPEYYQSSIIDYLAINGPELLIRTFEPKLLQRMYPAEYQSEILESIIHYPLDLSMQIFGAERLMQMFGPELLQQMYPADYYQERILKPLTAYGPEQLMITFGPELLQRMYPADYQSGILAPLTAYSPEQLMITFGPELLQQMYPADYYQEKILDYLTNYGPERLMLTLGPELLIRTFGPELLQRIYPAEYQTKILESIIHYPLELLMRTFGAERLMQMFKPELLQRMIGPLFFNKIFVGHGGTLRTNQKIKIKGQSRSKLKKIQRQTRTKPKRKTTRKRRKQFRRQTKKKIRKHCQTKKKIRRQR
jgi:hypothetical protein